MPYVIHFSDAEDEKLFIDTEGDLIFHFHAPCQNNHIVDEADIGELVGITMGGK